MAFSQLVLLGTVLLLSLCSPASRNIQKIRSIDFGNFEYSWNGDLGDAVKTFTLKDGQLLPTWTRDGKIDEMGLSLSRVEYGDVTADGVEEAVIFISVQSGGSAVPGVIFIYTLNDSQPKLLWSRSTGDRADGGYHGAFAENGKIVLELNSPEGSLGDCCPVQFERSEYEWNGRGFQQVQKQMVPITPHP